MNGISLKMTTFNDILANTQRDKAIYDGLSPEERAEVDAYNAEASVAFRKGGIKGILDAKLGDHPMKRFRTRWEENQ